MLALPRLCLRVVFEVRLFVLDYAEAYRRLLAPVHQMALKHFEVFPASVSIGKTALSVLCSSVISSPVSFEVPQALPILPRFSQQCFRHLLPEAHFRLPPARSKDCPDER